MAHQNVPNSAESIRQIAHGLHQIAGAFSQTNEALANIEQLNIQLLALDNGLAQLRNRQTNSDINLVNQILVGADHSAQLQSLVDIETGVPIPEFPPTIAALCVIDGMLLFYDSFVT